MTPDCWPSSPRSAAMTTDLCPDSPPSDVDHGRTVSAVGPTAIDREQLPGTAAPGGALDDAPQVAELDEPRRAVGARQSWVCSLWGRVSEARSAAGAARAAGAAGAPGAEDERAERAPHRSEARRGGKECGGRT